MAAGRGLVPSPPEPLLAHLFEIYGKIFWTEPVSRGAQVAWEGSARATTILEEEGAGMGSSS